MDNVNVNITTVCGKNIVTREEGHKVLRLILELWEQGKPIVIDFDNVTIASVSFIDEIFGKLAFQYPLAELSSRIKVKNIQEFDRALLNDIVKSRSRQKQLAA